MKLVEDWKNGWKWFSCHCMALAAIILAVYYFFLPDDLRSAIPAKEVAWVVLIVIVVGLAARFIDQGGKLSVDDIEDDLHDAVNVFNELKEVRSGSGDANSKQCIAGVQPGSGSDRQPSGTSDGASPK